MYFQKTHLFVSPTDLANFLACRHKTDLDRRAAVGDLEKPHWRDPLADALAARGDRHEARHVERLRALGLSIADLSDTRARRLPPGDAIALTLDMMRGGADVIVQAPLGDQRWFGYADVLRRVSRPSALGDWSYEVEDTKLSREVRGGTILQLCVYSELVGTLQTLVPERFRVVTPGHVREYRFEDVGAHYRFIKARFLAHLENDGPALSAADPVEHCAFCRWWTRCNTERRRADHLRFVAGLGRLHHVELNGHGVTTLAALAGVPTPIRFRPRRGAPETYGKLREQARLQRQQRDSGQPTFELLSVEPGYGLCLLPEPRPGDLFLDLEGDPFAREPAEGTSEPSGREYLFGVYAGTAGSSGPSYSAHWAFDDAQERRAFEKTIDRIVAASEADPTIHVYHYGAYEPGALKRLAGRYATRGAELDVLLRAGRFVDLYAVIRRALRAGVERYSIKDLEPFYGFEREVPLADASDQRRIVEVALETEDPSAVTQEVQEAVEGYNRDDCRSALQLRTWLERLRGSEVARGIAIERPVVEPGEAPENVKTRELAVAAVRPALLAGVPANPSQRTPDQGARFLLAYLLDWQYREDKVGWWEYFRLRDLSEDDLFEEPKAVVGLAFMERVNIVRDRRNGRPTGSVVDRYAYPDQEMDIRRGDNLRLRDEVDFGTVVAIDYVGQLLDVRKGPRVAETHPRSAFAHDPPPNDAPAKAILRLGMQVVADGLNGARYRVGLDLLLRPPPRSMVPGEATILPIQGPPGSGKTHTGAEMICDLIRGGLRVGVTATSHKVIRNLLDAIAKAAARRGETVRLGHKIGQGDEFPTSSVVEYTDNAAPRSAIGARDIDVLGGTAWLWSREEFEAAVDVLVIDEAGQVSLAHALATSHATGSVVLLGDPQQLDQPQKGSHPDGVDVSVLEHLLAGHRTMPADRGVFLPMTYRLAPNLCRFTSEVFYESKLEPRSGLDAQRLDGVGPFNGAGLYLIEVPHEGNRSASDDEVDVVEWLVSTLVAPGALCVEVDQGTGASKGPRQMTPQDVLIVAPYNSQVSRLQERLEPRDLRVGTVDKFQGQEAPVVIYSMATSSPEDAPRGMEFLFSLNRLNVATSRAKCACILVASPRLFEPDCRTPRQMQLASALARYRELAKVLQSGLDVGSRDGLHTQHAR